MIYVFNEYWFIQYDNESSETHSLELHSQLVVGEFEGSGNGLEIVYQHAETHRGKSHDGLLICRHVPERVRVCVCRLTTVAAVLAALRQGW